MEALTSKDINRLLALADWFEDCKILYLENIPTGLIKAIRKLEIKEPKTIPYLNHEDSIGE